MQIPSRLKNNVVFLGIMQGDHFRPKATGFFVGIETKFGGLLYLVTAEHVIATLSRKHEFVFVRTNIPDFPISKLRLSQWTFHPDAERVPTDVAVTPIFFRGTAASNFLAMHTEALVTPENFLQREWGLGDEIVVIGLFRNHHGKAKNIPLVRVGSLAALPEEPVKTKWGYLDAYLVEMHSIGGLSGSPVYIHHPPVRVKDKGLEILSGERLMLLGLMQGHFDIPNLREDSVVEDDDGSAKESINTGVGVVIPAYKILETLNHPDLRADRDALYAKTEADAANLDVDDAPPATDANPTHLEDFTRLVGAAARKPRQED